MLLLVSGSVHPNPGPNSTNSVSNRSFKCKLSEVSVLACLYGFDVFAY